MSRGRRGTLRWSVTPINSASGCQPMTYSFSFYPDTGSVTSQRIGTITFRQTHATLRSCRDGLASVFRWTTSDKFSDIPCRKLVVLDTCHSGEVDALSQDSLKSALRALQGDLFFTLTATEGTRPAAEDKQRGLSAFTYWLLRGLRGEADGILAPADGTITLAEVAKFVQQRVPEDAIAGQIGQFPTAGPRALLGVSEIPLGSCESTVCSSSARSRFA